MKTVLESLRLGDKVTVENDTPCVTQVVTHEAKVIQPFADGGIQLAWGTDSVWFDSRGKEETDGGRCIA